MGWFFFIPLILILSGCGDRSEEKKGQDEVAHGKEEGHSEEGHNHGSEGSGATYEEGKGITLLEETKQSLGLELAEVSESDFHPEIDLTAQIYRSSAEASKVYGRERQGNAYATALVSSEIADHLKVGQKLQFISKKNLNLTNPGVVLKIDLAQLSVLGKAEVLVELPDKNNHLKVGEFIDVKVSLENVSKKHLNIPRSSVLETAVGNFVFVKNGTFLVRTEIKVGSQNKDSMEVLEGLYEGDTIVIRPVEALYLIELRAVKGGGHSH